MVFSTICSLTTKDLSFTIGTENFLGCSGRIPLLRQIPVTRSSVETCRLQFPTTLPIDAKKRIEFAKLIQEGYQSDVRCIGVAATGKDFDTLELSSGLIMNGTYTLDAAWEIYGAGTLNMVKQLKFKRSTINGTEPGYSESLPLQKK
jgi:hypothetical protein